MIAMTKEEQINLFVDNVMNYLKDRPIYLINKEDIFIKIINPSNKELTKYIRLFNRDLRKKKEIKLLKKDLINEVYSVYDRLYLVIYDTGLMKDIEILFE